MLMLCKNEEKNFFRRVDFIPDLFKRRGGLFTRPEFSPKVEDAPGQNLL